MLVIILPILRLQSCQQFESGQVGRYSNPKISKSTKTFEKRRPKNCKKYNTEKGCRFGSECDYYHRANQDFNQPCECQSKINILEKIVTEMSNKILNQENKLDDIKAFLTEDRELKEKVTLLESVVQKMFVKGKWQQSNT